jgi:glycine oxidase
MLAPITELTYTETPLLRLSLDSLSRYPAFAAELAEATGLPTGYLECGTVEIAWDGADLATLRELQAFGGRLGLGSRMLTGRELRQMEPAVAPGLPGGLLAPDDHQVDPRLLHAALVAAGTGLGVETVTTTASVDVTNGRAIGVRCDDGTRIAADSVVLAAGAWSAEVGGAPRQTGAPVRPVKGQTLRLRLSGPPRLAHCVRGQVKGSRIYVLPRRDGEYVVGASVEEAGFDQTPRAGAVYELLRDACSVVPELGEATLTEISTGLRPGSPDNAPIIGEATGLDGLVLATGHYRNGILLSPVTADGIADLITTGSLPEVLAPFSSSRFAAEVPAC